jgi:predicted amidohydrolase YtcJ
VRVGGAKFFTDPTDPDTMYLSEPHSNQPGYYGDFAITSPEEIISLVVQLDDLGWQVAIHTGGDAGLDVVLDAFEAALDGGPNDLRHRVEHLPVVRDDQIERMLSLGVVASFQLTWFHSDWIGDPDWGSFEENLGPERIAWAGRWRDLLDSGVTVIGGSDHPWTPPVSIGGFAEAVTRTGAGGLAPEPWMAAQTITIDEAIALLTVDAAYGAFEENVKGTLTPGKLADLIVVSANPLQIPPEQLFDLEVLVTVVGGETVYCAQADSGLCP